MGARLHSGGGVGYHSMLTVIELLQDCWLDVIVHNEALCYFRDSRSK